MEIWMIGFQLKRLIQLRNNWRSFLTQGDVALSLPLVAHPRLTADMRFGSCRASTQIATQLLISANVIGNKILQYDKKSWGSCANKARQKISSFERFARVNVGPLGATAWQM
jgi:hypothetical protein